MSRVMIIPVELWLQLDARMLTFAAALVVAAVASGLLPSLRLVPFANAAAVYQAAHAHTRARPRKDQRQAGGSAGHPGGGRLGSRSAGSDPLLD